MRLIEAEKEKHSTIKCLWHFKLKEGFRNALKQNHF